MRFKSPADGIMTFNVPLHWGRRTIPLTNISQPFRHIHPSISHRTMPRMLRASLPTSAFGDMSNDVTLPPAYEDEEDDVEYDVYLYWSSTAPHVLIPEHSAQDPLSEVRATSSSRRILDWISDVQASSPTAYSHHSESSDELYAASLAPVRPN